MREKGSRNPLGKEYTANKTNEQNDYTTKDSIYKQIIEMLADKRLYEIETGKFKNSILDTRARNVLVSEDSLSLDEIAQLEKLIQSDATHNSIRYEERRNIPCELYTILKKQGNTDLIFDKDFLPLPTFIENALICQELQNKFCRKDLLACPGFLETISTDEQGIIHRSIRLNIHESIVRRGFLLPLFRNKLIWALKVYRSVLDERPFLLNSRVNYYKRERDGNK